MSGLNKATILVCFFLLSFVISKNEVTAREGTNQIDDNSSEKERPAKEEGESSKESIRINEQAIETAGDLNYEEIQAVIDDVIGTKGDVDFEGYVGEMISGEKGVSVSGIFGDIKKTVGKELNDNKKIILQLITIAIVAAIFTNFSSVFKNNQVADTGFYITYLLLFSILTISFYSATTVASEVLSMLLDFMKALIPTYVLSIAFCAGSNTSMIFYESTLVIITVVDFVLIKVIIPLINIYFILVLANNLSKEDMLSKFTELLELVIQWTLKTLLATVIGFNAIQSLIVPMADHVKNTFILKTTSAIPGIGNTFGNITETVLGAGVLVKNAIGVAGLVVIITICAIPLVKLVLFVLIYKFGVAIVQPISDKRILNCMNASAEAARLLLYTVFIGTILFLLTIAIMTAATNLRV